jgi:hypothetical protein
MKNLKHIEEKNHQTQFDKKVLSVIQHLHPYVKHRLYIGESIGVLPKNMYTSNGIIDEGIVTLYEKGFDEDEEVMHIKLKVFGIVDNELDAIFKKEAFHENTISTDSILKEELDGLKETYTVDEDFDYIMSEELNDISYKQNNRHKHLFLYDDTDSTILNAFEIEDLSSSNKEALLGRMYSLLPIKTSDILDLYVFGKLSFQEISQVKQVDIKQVEKLFRMINKNFRKNLG